MRYVAVDDIGPSPGWVELHVSDEGMPRVLAKFERHGDRHQITRLVIDGEVNSSTLRAIPIGRLESLLNIKDRSDNLVFTDRRSVVDDDGDDYEPAFPAGRDLEKVDEVLDHYLKESADLYESLRDSLQEHPSNWAPRKRKPLTRPDRTDPVAFSRRVAEAYNAVVQRTPKPATVLAQEAGVPVTTVHRWIREARQRGFLPPARQGRAG